ncbi:hypothetical protein DM02DRAFT_407513 [Periconia macrospinosa]|uniref:Uncharacterized protein n=1 Tax=Periconia macrospinosa TaxID=97972 RepID=A0A2V1EBX3_9PLEO|nr:hypothetical protein DM02DRAFT_407513 [Periconia macrospinosa]
MYAWYLCTYLFDNSKYVSSYIVLGMPGLWFSSDHRPCRMCLQPVRFLYFPFITYLTGTCIAAYYYEWKRILRTEAVHPWLARWNHEASPPPMLPPHRRSQLSFGKTACTDVGRDLLCAYAHGPTLDPVSPLPLRLSRRLGRPASRLNGESRSRTNWRHVVSYSKAPDFSNNGSSTIGQYSMSAARRV